MYVINEWFWADLAGNNGAQNQRETFEFLKRFAASTLRMVVVEGSKFDQKAWALCGSKTAVLAGIGKAFFTEIRLNSERCRILKPDELTALPQPLIAAVKAGDHYLIQAYLAGPCIALSTTDMPLIGAVAPHGINCISRAQTLALV